MKIYKIGEFYEVNTLLVVEDARGSTDMLRRDENGKLWHTWINSEGAEFPWYRTAHESCTIQAKKNHIVHLDI